MASDFVYSTGWGEEPDIVRFGKEKARCVRS